jgi:hypothetical protein
VGWEKDEVSFLGVEGKNEKEELSLVALMNIKLCTGLEGT